ncbi:MAG: HigA family addiction module antitoxin, partial [Acidobacteriota bacterium]
MAQTRAVAEVFPPGEFVRDELESRDWTQADLAKIMDRPVQAVNEIVSGKKAITPETAIGLSQAFGTTPELWLNLEMAYRLSLVECSDDTVARKAKIYSFAPIADMVKRNWIEDGLAVPDLEKRVTSFFEVKSLDEAPSFSFAARKSTSYDMQTVGQWAWIFQAKRLASTLQMRPYSPNHLKQALVELKKLTVNPEDVRHVPRVLTNAGIRFVIVEQLAGSRMDGAAFWLSEKEPVIAISLRFDRIDWFWFTLGHELGHIHDGNENFIDADLTQDDAERPDAERRADEFSSNLTIPSQELNDFILRTRPLFSKKRIIGFATRIGVHPGIVVGQFTKLIDYELRS